ncbi:MAG: SDR family oxidoreductase [Cyclobacteriaceae bacterium]|nr:SDR family oxidoreductase [Cyclobacteriaceae bacterium]
MNPTVLLLGAGSDVARSLAVKYASLGYTLQLAARTPTELQPWVAQLPGNPSVQCLSFDATNFESHSSFVNSLTPLPDIAICVVGYLGTNEKALQEWAEAKKIMDTNYTGVVSICNALATAFVARGSGVIAGISSVAGERGRQSNFIYGSAKAGFTAYLSGLRNRLVKTGVHVLTVKPGFINTRMTAGLQLPIALTASPQQVASVVATAIARKRNTVYVLAVWIFIMCIIRNIPEFIFKRMKL